MSRLVIIGNGFDIAQGIATRYSNFMQYLNTFEKFPKFINDTYYLLDSVSEKDQAKHKFYDALCKYIPEEGLWSSFEEALNMLDIEAIKENNSEYLVGYGDDN
ncbi:hypothetical protein HLQ16_10440 [Clostridium estertheticum]|uniref:Uncharacterized protein n=1 Tax=Clostridium estertheticum TaxID=238834 RepID=A0A7Y3WSV9_9CLOT|nr:hypothetical protein [Clostridium estertheticum]